MKYYRSITASQRAASTTRENRKKLEKVYLKKTQAVGVLASVMVYNILLYQNKKLTKNLNLLINGINSIQSCSSDIFNFIMSVKLLMLNNMMDENVYPAMDEVVELE